MRVGTLLLRPLLLAALLAPASVALADHPFILPANTLYSGDGNTVTFDAAGSDHVFFFDHRPLGMETIRITRPDGTAGTPQNPTRTRFRSVFDVRLDQQGTWKVASDQTMVIGSFKLDGEERRVGGRGGPPPGAQAAQAAQGGGARPDGGRREEGARGGAPGGPGGGEAGPRRQPPVALEDIPAAATDIHLTEMVNRTETFVTDGAPTTAALKPAGHGLELEPITHPNAIVAGETARFRLLVDGKPAAGVKVTVIPGGDRYRDDVGTMLLTSGADGVVAVKWPRAGMYWLGAEAEDAYPAQRRADTRRMSYAATLEVMTP